MRSLLIAFDMVFLLGLSLTRPFVGVLLFCWISFMNPHQLAYGFASQAPWALMAGIATVIGCFVAGEPKRLPVTAVTVLMALFMVVITATTAVAMSPLTDQVVAKYVLVMKSFGFILLTISLLTTRRRIHALIWLMVISLAFFGSKGGVFTILHGGGGGRVEGPPGTMITDNNDLAVALLITLPLMNFLRVHSADRLVRIGIAVVMGLTLLAVLGSYSRGALIALAAVACFFWLKSRRKIVYGVLVFGAIAGAVAFMPQEWVARMQTIQSYQADQSAEGRLKMWHTAWIMAEGRPLTGVGFMGTYSRKVVDRFDPTSAARAVHSIWLELLAENGFPAFFIWLGITGAGALAARRIIRRTRDRPDLAWCADLARMTQVSIIAYVVGGTLLSLSYWDFYFTVLGVLTATDLYVRRALASRDELPGRISRPWRQLGSDAGGVTVPAR
ncbi:MAG: putative O-glycosylation ligase, exosortase A system-associated [Acetobacteraceae bacterium]